MAYQPRILTSESPYHVTARTNNKDWFELPLERVWSVICEKVQKVTEDYGAEVNVLVLMSNHLHLILSTPMANINSIMQYLMREVSKTLGPISGRINHLFGRRYHSSIIHEPIHFAHVLKYVYRNPVVAGLADKCEQYPFSTIRGQLSKNFAGFPLCEVHPAIASLVPKDSEDFLRWLNEPTSPEKREMIRKALRRAEFRYSRQKCLRPLVKELETTI